MTAHITNGSTSEERLAELARQIVITKLVLRGPASHLTDKPFALKPDTSDFISPFRVALRKELLLVRIDESQQAHRWDRVTELERELAEAEKEIIRLVL
jgi:predicted ribosome quality control (RQC) complex YloA/Tae2 family protein